MRTPRQIIGDDAYTQLVFEGYAVVPQTTLQPFKDFAKANVDAVGWASNIHREPISNWFGPSDFRNLVMER